jgi:hypothetical protein
MATNDNNPEDQAREEEEVAFDFWSDEGAQRFNDMLDEGSAYLTTHPHGFADPEMDIDDQESEYRDPELYDPDEETLPAGELELILENSYTM